MAFTSRNLSYLITESQFVLPVTFLITWQLWEVNKRKTCGATMYSAHRCKWLPVRSTVWSQCGMWLIVFLRDLVMWTLLGCLEWSWNMFPFPSLNRRLWTKSDLTEANKLSSWQWKYLHASKYRFLHPSCYFLCFSSNCSSHHLALKHL